jgi:hypothetical protein
MWPFRRKEKKVKTKKRKALEGVVAGLIIGGAVSAIVGKTLLEKHEKEDEKK